MKHLFIALALSMTFLAVGCTKPSLQGTYKRIRTDPDLNLTLVETMDFNQDGTFRRTSSMGTIIEGTYVISGIKVIATFKGPDDILPGGHRAWELTRSGDALLLQRNDITIRFEKQ